MRELLDRQKVKHVQLTLTPTMGKGGGLPIGAHNCHLFVITKLHILEMID